MEAKIVRAAAIAVALLVSANAMAADKAKTDKSVLIGTWTVSSGIYPDGTVESELEMEFAFTDKALTNPMDQSQLPWSIDEKAKLVTASGASGAMTLGYKILDADTVELTLLKVKKDKEMVIVGDKGTFTSLKLSRKK